MHRNLNLISIHIKYLNNHFCVIMAYNFQSLISNFCLKKKNSDCDFNFSLIIELIQNKTCIKEVLI